MLRKRDLLRSVKVEVDPVLEIAQVNDRVVKGGGPALLFENCRGSKFACVVNLFGSFERMALALQVDNLEMIGAEILEFLEPDIPTNLIEKLKALPKLKRLADFIPKYVKTGPCKEVINREVSSKVSPTLCDFPVLQTWPGDGGRFITLPMVFTKDPETGQRNCGMYRMQVYDENTTGMHWHMHKGGAAHYRKACELGVRLEVAVVIGSDPACMYSATAPLPEGIDEMLFAGFLRKSPVELVKCETVNLEVPANSEIVLEGYVEPGQQRPEGPFGDHTGYYCLVDNFPVFHLTCITHRKDAIYPATIVGKPPMEDCYIAKATERIFLPLIKKQLPEIVDMNLPMEGVFHNLAIVSIDKSYPGQARKIMYALWGMGQMSFTKMIVVVDKWVDVQNPREVIWRIGNNVDAKRDLVILEGPLDVLEHASQLPAYGGKLGIDATKKLPSEGFTRQWPDDIVMSDDIVRLVQKRWAEYGI
ncbi:menaquinone biosynthesis decarboxylase, family [Candidatus Magnetobacterium bavaricum]|uniref:Menaquinone biosynthesis decarboxylase, family n=1 Tax=Candidatus Magnetobacterium bavaricum TaxID=29290 RepID=A0A0F3GZ73_9BACT|nr:menaquinone biosynthesis decarboxylase, family [Candidatus Magnetobacterium bavaricum]